ncbi:general transcription factor 3C polypeptide 1 [Dermacentor variabilis]|uniref:general transcription factor 3C polypeptide 1 n=1 Tax=Dermacentor variabilis TaxID=34621 RepID=UPI003F5BB09F
MTSQTDFYSCCVDEIALEGLDGITLQALWVRLQLRPNFPLSLDSKSKAFIWSALVPETRLSFYALKEPRMDLVIYDRYKHVDPNTGYVVEPNVLPPDPYPYKLVNKNGQLGSCCAFDTRKDVSDEVRRSSLILDDVVAKWGNRLVIVADQMTRERALIGPNNTIADLDLSEMKYCILERIGRSRYLGQTTQGQLDLRVMNITHASMFIMRKQLVQRNLITKQDFCLKTESGGSKVGFLLHLPRFFVEVKTKRQIMARELCALLDSKPNKREETSKLFNELGLTPAAAKKLMYGPASKYVARHAVPYSEFYPNSPREEWYTKNNKPRNVRICELVRPYEEEEEEEDVEGYNADKSTGLFFHPQKYTYDRPRLSQAYKEVYKTGTAGMTLRELSAALMATRLEVRNLQKGLMKRQLVVPYREDVGKQRVIRYFCPEFATKSEMHKKILAEKKRMLEQPRVEPPPAKKRKTDTSSLSKSLEAAEVQEVTKAEEEVEKTESAAKKAGTAAVIKQPPVGTCTTREVPKEAEKGIDTLPSCSTSSDSLHDSSADTLEVEQPTITVETNSACFFRKVKPQATISFPTLSEVTDRKPLQKLLPSYRMLTRANRILEYIKAETVVTDLSKLQKALQKAEEEEGSTTKLDRVSLRRLLSKLCNGGYLKTIHTVLRLGQNVRDLKLICMPSVTKDDEIVKAAIEQAKFKYFQATPKEPKKPECSPAPEASTCSKMTYNPAMGRYYGAQPKFRRMHLCYAFMHYLLYSYDGVLQERLSDDPSTPAQYQKDVSWKMFVPPLSNSPSTPNGWVLFADILLSLPLSLFVKIASSIKHKIEGLEEYLHDKIKCHYLIRSLPVKLRNALLFARRYIYSIHETVKRLAFVGMVTFGPQRLKEKDQVYLFLHRNLCIKDTKISHPGYHQVSTDIEYPVKHFFLETQQDVDHFWLEVENTCICTPLGMPQSIQGQTIELQNLYKKPAMIEACRNREFGEEQDNGIVPGDQLGAAGFDSALFAHLKRNWACASPMPAKLSTSAAESRKPNPKGAKPLQRLLSYLDRASKNTGSSPPQKQSQKRVRDAISRMSVYYPKQPDGEPLAVPVVKGAKKADEHQPRRKAPQRKKSDITVRVVQPRKRHNVRRPYYDDKDQAALKEMKTMRVSWSSQEDIVLLMCKVCSWFLDRHLDKMVVPFTVIRDILNERFPELSKDKTSRACQRRLRFMLLNPATKVNASVFLCEAQQDQKLVEMFHGPKPVKSDEKQWLSMFRTVLDHLMQKFSKSSEERHREVTLPNSFDELKDRYEIIVSGQVEMDSWSYTEPHNLVDIHFSSVAIVILSSLAADDGKSNWSLMLYKIYEQYPDNLVRSVTARLRHNGVICRKHPNAKKLFISLNLSMLPFTLSNKFQFDMTRRYSPQHITLMGKFLLELLTKRRSGEPCSFHDGIEPAYAPLLFTLQLMNKLSYTMEVPQAIVEYDCSMTAGKTHLRKPEPTASLAEEPLGSNTTLSDKAKSLNFVTSGCNAKTSRSFLYMLRQDMTKALQYNYLRPQDYIVIKSCKLNFSLTDEDLIPGWTLEDPTDKSYALKVRNSLYDKIVQEQRACYSLSAVSHCWTGEGIADAYKQEGKAPEDAQLGTEIYYFILKKEQLGVTYAQLCEALNSAMDSMTLNSHLDFLVEKKMILRIGVTCIRYVALQHCKPWVIRTFKIPKEMRAYTCTLGEQEHVLRAKVKKVAVTDQLKPTADTSGRSENAAEGSTDAGGTTAEGAPGSTGPEPSSSCTLKSAGKESSSASSVSKDERSEIGWKNANSRRTRDSNSSCLKRTYYEAMTKNINVENFEKIMYIPRLWRKPDGTLNRPVFFQLLSAVLSYILDNPGVTEDQFRANFSRQIEPCVQTLDMLRILEQMGCIRRFFMRMDTAAKCSLFSKRRQLVICDKYCPGDIVCYDGTLEALVNFTAFSVHFQK